MAKASKPKRYQLPWIEPAEITAYEQKYKRPPLIIGREYEYMDQPVRLIQVRGVGDMFEATVESRFGSLTTIDAAELVWRT